MNSTVLFLYFLLFMTTLVSAIVFMWKSMTESFKALGQPVQTNVHPEMRDVQSGTELLVFHASEDEDEDDGEGDVVVVRK
tara:strand:+ start:1481 stop:1720 length:240 start_codon:yes stop_codon:yes gene_type:complete